MILAHHSGSCHTICRILLSITVLVLYLKVVMMKAKAQYRVSKKDYIEKLFDRLGKRHNSKDKPRG